MPFEKPDQPTQRALQAIAHSLDLEYEFSLATRDARIARRVAFYPGPDTDARVHEPSTSQQQTGAREPSPASNIWGPTLGFDQTLPLVDDGPNDTSFDLYSWLQDSDPLSGGISGAPGGTNVTGQPESHQSADGAQDQPHRPSTFYSTEPQRQSLLLETYVDPDDIGLRYSPPVRPMRTNLPPSPPLPAVPLPPLSPSAPPTDHASRRSNSRPDQEDKDLLSPMAGIPPDNGITTESQSRVSNDDSSDRPGRSSSRRPLSSIARASSRAVKALGACWRCRFLRDKVLFSAFCSVPTFIYEKVFEIIPAIAMSLNRH
jgi:hypothetical protein